MVAAGMTPAQVIVAATRNSAEFLRLTDAGTIAAGKSADFVVLDANPLDDITNTRRIRGVSARRGRRPEFRPVRSRPAADRGCLVWRNVELEDDELGFIASRRVESSESARSAVAGAAEEAPPRSCRRCSAHTERERAAHWKVRDVKRATAVQLVTIGLIGMRRSDPTSAGSLISRVADLEPLATVRLPRTG